MRTVREIYDALFAFAPERMKMGDWDNVGLLCGRFTTEVETVLVALDPLPDVIAEAVELGAQCIVTHHPLFFDPPRAINETTLAGRSVLELIEHGIAAVNLHTNLDCAPGGVNDALAAKLELDNVRILNLAGEDDAGQPYGLLRIGETEQTDVRTFAAFVKEKLACPGLRFADAGRPVQCVAVGGGSCGSAIDEVLAAGCDTFVTADLKYHQFEEARWRGLNLIDAGHFETEDPVCEVLAMLLRERFPELRVLKSTVHRNETQFFG